MSGGGKADAAGADDSLVVRDVGDHNVERPVLRLEHDHRLAGAGRGERRLEPVGRARVDELADDLAAGEAELDPYAILSHSPPPPRVRRGPSLDGRTRLRGRTCPAAASRRSAARRR